MKLSKIMFAVATLALGASVVAAPSASRIAVGAGASATLGNLGNNSFNTTPTASALNALCVSAGGVLSRFGGVTAGAPSGNFTTFTCSTGPVMSNNGAAYTAKPDSDFINFAGTSYAELRYNSEGSFSAILLNNNQALNFRDPATATNTTALPAGSVKVGGILDIDPIAFPPSTIGTNVIRPVQPVGIAQTFGVAVSNLLYTAMFNAQQAAGKIPPTCTVASTSTSYCVPSIGRAQMATIMADNEFNPAYSKGVGFLTGVAADNGKELRYVRRVDNSGTQASAQNYFLGLTCQASAQSIVAEPTGDAETGGLKDRKIGNIRVLAAPGTGDVRNELIVAANYSIGVMSGENNQAQTWKWLRIDGVPIGENAAPGSVTITNINTQKDGSYDFYFESVYEGGGTAGDAFWATVSGALNSLPAPTGLIEQSILASGYTKGGLACAASGASN